MFYKLILLDKGMPVIQLDCINESSAISYANTWCATNPQTRGYKLISPSEKTLIEVSSAATY